MRVDYPSNRSLLIVDDETNMRHMLSVMLSLHGYDVDQAADGDQGLKLLAAKGYAIVLCDVRMPKTDGLSFLSQAKKVSPDVTIVMMSAYGSVEDAVQAMKLGAYDYIAKPFKEDEILLVLQKGEERIRLINENQRLKEQVAQVGHESGFGGMIGKAASMRSVYEMASKVAKHTTTVLVTGESGTGKELVARGIHDISLRREKPFIAVNCGSIPESLIESELFGYAKGAFTGADRNKEGLFEAASGGTLFLDEIGEVPMAMQVKLLRVLQEREVRRIGAAKDISVDVRVIAATARQLPEMVEEGQFREDLYYRLNVVNIQVPPLRERRDDIPALCEFFVRKMNVLSGKNIEGISSKAMELILKHEWHGNVRELENVIERAVILSDQQFILPENLPEVFSTVSHDRRLGDFLGTYSLKKAKVIMEQKMISRAMGESGGNKSKAAKMLEISYPALLQKIKMYQID